MEHKPARYYAITLMKYLLMFREELIASLQAEEQERQWYYTQLELIAQKIRNIPLSSLHSVSTSVHIKGVHKKGSHLAFLL